MKARNIIQGDAKIDKARKNLRNKISVVCEKIKCDDKELRNGINVQLAKYVRVPLPSYSPMKLSAQTRCF